HALRLTPDVSLRLSSNVFRLSQKNAGKAGVWRDPAWRRSEPDQEEEEIVRFSARLSQVTVHINKSLVTGHRSPNFTSGPRPPAAGPARGSGSPAGERQSCPLSGSGTGAG